MAASGRGLGRALHSSAGPAWKRAQSGAQGHLKPEYDAVVIGAGKAKKAVLREGGQCPAHRPLGTLQGALLWSQPVIRLVIQVPHSLGVSSPWFWFHPGLAVWSRGFFLSRMTRRTK